MFHKARQLIGLVVLAAGLVLPAASAQAAPDGHLIKTAKERGTLRVGMAEHVPAQFKDPVSGEWKGFNVDMARNLADLLGVELEFVSSTWSSLIPGLQAGKYEIIMSDVYATPERALVVNFTDVYMTQSNILAVRKDLELSNYRELNSPEYTFAAISGTASSKSVDANFPEANKKELVTDNEFAHLLELATGRVDAVLYERMTVERFLESNPKANIRIMPGVSLDVQGASYAIQPGDYRSLNFLNTWISYLERRHKLEELKRKWFIEYQKEQTGE